MRIYEDAFKEKRYLLLGENIVRRYMINNEVILLDDKNIFEEYLEYLNSEDSNNSSYPLSLYEYCDSKGYDCKLLGGTHDCIDYLDSEEVEDLSEEYQFAVENDELGKTDEVLTAFEEFNCFPYYDGNNNTYLILSDDYIEVDFIVEDTSPMPHGSQLYYEDKNGIFYSVYSSNYGDSKYDVVDEDETQEDIKEKINELLEKDE